VSAKDRRNATRHEGRYDWWEKVMSSRLNDQRTGARVIVHAAARREGSDRRTCSPGGYQHLSFADRVRSEAAIGHGHEVGQTWADPRTRRASSCSRRSSPREVVEQIKIDLGTYDYSAQHGQKPLA
jgi:hypothetical protein